MSRSLLVAGLLAAVLVCAAAGGADNKDEGTANTEYYKKHVVDPPTYAPHDQCAGPTSEVVAASPIFASNSVGNFREVNVTCSGATSCVKSGTGVNGCLGFGQPGDAGTALDASQVTGVVAGSTLQVGGRCEIQCDTASGLAVFSLFNNGFTTGLSGQTECGIVKVEAGTPPSNCRVVATAVCCAPKKHIQHHGDYSG